MKTRFKGAEKHWEYTSKQLETDENCLVTHGIHWLKIWKLCKNLFENTEFTDKEKKCLK